MYNPSTPSDILEVMIYSLAGTLAAKMPSAIVVEIGGFGLKVAVSPHTFDALPAPGSPVRLFAYLHVREGVLDLYGFATEKERGLFERLNSISGIGPKSAMAVLNIAQVDRLIAAINEGKSDLLTKASGIGRKTAERVILELKGKLEIPSSGELVTLMESDVELEETLVSLGYTKKQARDAIAKIGEGIAGFKDRLKAALKESKKQSSQ